MTHREAILAVAHGARPDEILTEGIVLRPPTSVWGRPRHGARAEPTQAPSAHAKSTHDAAMQQRRSLACPECGGPAWMTRLNYAKYNAAKISGTTHHVCKDDQCSHAFDRAF